MVARRVAAKRRLSSTIDQLKAGVQPLESERKNRVSSKARLSILSRHMKPAHKRMSRMLGYCLTLGTVEAWAGFSLVAAVRLAAASLGAVEAWAGFSLVAAVRLAAASLGAAGGGMTERELDEILPLYWPRVLRRVMAPDGDEWARGFARSIARQGKRPDWRPSPKQAWIMRRMVQGLFETQDELELIER